MFATGKNDQLPRWEFVVRSRLNPLLMRYAKIGDPFRESLLSAVSVHANKHLILIRPAHYSDAID